MGQFERTLIIADEGSSVHYVEGCTAPTYASDSLHSAVVEIIVKERARPIHHYSKLVGNVYNLVTKRAMAYQDARCFGWTATLAPKLPMKYPQYFLWNREQRRNLITGICPQGQHQDAGGKSNPSGPDTTSTITSKSISKNGGTSTYRGLVKVIKAQKCKTRVVCDALMLDSTSRSDTYPTMDIKEEDVAIAHEATVGRIGEDELFYLMSRGLSEEQKRPR